MAMSENYALNKANRDSRSCWIVPVFLGMLFALGDTIAASEGKLVIEPCSFVARFAIFSILFAALLTICKKAVLAVCREKTPCDFVRSIKRWPDAVCAFDQIVFGNRPLIAIMIECAIVAAFWAPWFVALFPGVYWSDTSQQLLEYYGMATLSDHHPYTTTLIFGWFADFGNRCLSSASNGLFLLVLIQGGFAVYFFSRLVWELRKGGLSPLGSILLLAFVAIFPLIPVMFCSLAKDTLSCVFFLGFVLQIVVVVLSQGEKLRCPKVLIALAVFGLLAALMKKTAGFVVLLCLISLAVAYRDKSNLVRCGSICVAIAMIVFVLFPRVLLPLGGVEPGGKQEVVATLIQQVAHDVVYNGDNLTDHEREVIDDFLLVKTDEMPSRYSWKLADPIKLRGLNNDSRMGDFIAVWASNTLKHPRGHLEAWLGLVDGWITFRADSQGSPNYMVVLTYSGWHDDGIEQCVDWNDQPTARSERAAAIYGALQSIPVINILFFRSTWATILPFFSLFLLFGMHRCDRLKGLAFAMPMVATLVPLAITPVSAFGGEPTRYIFALICVGPFLIAAMGIIACRQNQAGGAIRPQGNGEGRPQRAHTDAGMHAAPAPALPRIHMSRSKFWIGSCK